MKREEALLRIEELRVVLHRHHHEYYVLGSPSVSDLEYDRLFDQLVSLEKAFPDLVTQDSPTHRVGSDLDASFPEAAHSVPVLSLDKAYEEAEVLRWMRRLAESEGRALAFTAEEKIDGISIVLYYEKGVLERALTRGDGSVGNDVTVNVRTIRRVPLRLPDAVDVAVRGEIFLTTDAFKKLNASMDPPYANARNLAGGSLRRVKSSEVARIPLDLIVYEGFFQDGPDSHGEILNRLRELGLPVDERVAFLPPGPEGYPAEAARELIRRFTRERPDLAYQVDGIVFKVDELSVRESLGFTGHHPRWALAYKFESPQGLTRIRAIDVQVGRTGRITPVARVEPVEIGGSLISNVTLHNQAFIDMLEISPGDLVSVSRRGDVIPAVERVVEKAEGARLWRMPSVCPSCGAELEERGGHHFCPDNGGCPDQRRGRIQFFVSRGQMDIENLGSETVDLLLSRGLVRDIPDIYALPYEKLLSYPGFGKKKIEAIRAGVEKSRGRPFRIVLAALGLPELGPRLADLLIGAGYDSIDRLLDAAAAGDLGGLTAIHGVGEKTARRLLDELAKPEVRTLISALRSAGLRFAEDDAPVHAAPAVFAGQTWCVTGSFETFRPRELAMEEVRRRGGRVVSSVSGALTHLLAGKDAGSKLEKARSLGVAIVDEKAFIDLLK